MAPPEFIESLWLQMPPKKNQNVGKQCIKCGNYHPEETYEPGRSVCHSCRMKQKGEANRLRKLRKITPDFVPAPEKHPSIQKKKHAHLIVDPPEPPPRKKRAPKKAKRATVTAFSDRSSAKSYFIAQLQRDIEALDDLITRYDEMAEDTLITKELKDITARKEATVQKRIDLSMRLFKELDLGSDLGKPVDDNPLYTPVTVVINTKMPSSCIVQPKFERDPEFIQPEVADGDDDSTAADEDTE